MAKATLDSGSPSYTPAELAKLLSQVSSSAATGSAAVDKVAADLAAAKAKQEADAKAAADKAAKDAADKAAKDAADQAARDAAAKAAKDAADKAAADKKAADDKAAQEAAIQAAIAAALAAAGIGPDGKSPTPGQKYTASDGTVFTDENAYATYESGLSARYAANKASADAASAAAATKAYQQYQKDLNQREASSLVKDWLSSFFDPKTDAGTIEALMNAINDDITSDMPATAIMLNLRTNPIVQARFSGNKALRAKGIAELTPAQYLDAERSYSSLLASAGLSGIGTRENFAKMIGGEVSATELQDRITNVYERINNADAALQDELGKFFNLGLSKSDLAAALLTGGEGASSLKRKVSMAEIGSEFTPRGLTSALGVEQLQQLGVSREAARSGAEYTQQGMQSLTKLSDIYNVDQTGLQAELESEAFKGLQSQRRKQLTATEKAAFSGASGTGSPSLGRTSAGAI